MWKSLLPLSLSLSLSLSNSSTQKIRFYFSWKNHEITETLKNMLEEVAAGLLVYLTFNSRNLHEIEHMTLKESFWVISEIRSFVHAIFFLHRPHSTMLEKAKKLNHMSSSEKEGFRISETSQWFPPKHENPSHEWWWWRRGTSYSRNTPTLSTFLSLSLSSSHRTILHKRLSLLLTCTPRILGGDDQIAQRTRRVLKYRNKSL